MAKAKNWAIVVGVNAYKRTEELQYANRDAEAMRAFFKEANFDEVFCFADGLKLERSAQEITDQPDTEPTRSNLEDFLLYRFTSKNRPLASGDNCWFFFAGHGKRIGDRDYLLPIDYNDDVVDREGRAISVDFVRECLLKSGADNVILLLDACRSDGGRSSGQGIGSAQPGAITVFSCGRNQKAYEIEALRQGAFTAALLEALRMPGERNCATVERLDLYLQHRVPQICQQYQKPKQLPTTHVEPRQKSYLVLLPEFATDRDWDALRREAMDAELEDNFEFAEQLWIRLIAATQGQDLKALQAYARVLGKKSNDRSSTRQQPTTDRPTQARSANPSPSEVPAKPQVITVNVAGKEISHRLAQLQKNLIHLYRLLEASEDGAIRAISKIDKLRYEMKADELKPQIRAVEQEYARLLVQQVKREGLPEAIAETVVGELVDELEMMQPIAKTDEMRSMLQAILTELRKPGTPAAAKLKVAISLVPGFVAIEFEGDTESLVRRLFPTFVKAYEGMKTIGGK